MECLVPIAVDALIFVVMPASFGLGMAVTVWLVKHGHVSKPVPPTIITGSGS